MGCRERDFGECGFCRDKGNLVQKIFNWLRKKEKLGWLFLNLLNILDYVYKFPIKIQQNEIFDI